MLFFNIAAFTVDAHVTVCGKPVHPGQIECMHLLHQPYDGSMFDVFPPRVHRLNEALSVQAVRV
jgi:hypothetical protein